MGRGASPAGKLTQWDRPDSNREFALQRKQILSLPRIPVSPLAHVDLSRESTRWSLITRLVSVCRDRGLRDIFRKF